MSEKLLLKSESLSKGQLGKVKENAPCVVFSQGRRKPPLQQLVVVAMGQ